ncbi:MAG TPA: transposase [Terracidiphilus sp.]|jgi:putative transposase
MAHPARNASSTAILNPPRIFFATTKTHMGRRLLQSERNAHLLIDVPRALVAERKFELHDFVIMPDHLHLLLTVHNETTVERAMQLIKGRFSYRLSHEFGYKGEVWQRGFTGEQVMNRESFETHREYIAQNPVKAGMAVSTDEFPFCFRSLTKRKAVCGPAEAVPLLQSKNVQRLDQPHKKYRRSARHSNGSKRRTLWSTHDRQGPHPSHAERSAGVREIRAGQASLQASAA